MILRDEDTQLFQDRRDAIRVHLDPVGELEEVLVEQIVVCAWRLRRLEHIEASLFQYQVFDQEATRAGWLARTFESRTSGRLS